MVAANGATRSHRRGVEFFGHRIEMRLGLIDVLFAVACMAIGMVLGAWVASDLPPLLRPLAWPLIGLGLYLALVYPVYRGFKLLPMIFPRCPCCRSFQRGLDILGGSWPRVTYRCPSCKGAFVIWHNGKAGDQETWDKPVLALKWPYALGRYRPLRKPEPDGRGA